MAHRPCGAEKSTASRGRGAMPLGLRLSEHEGLPRPEAIEKSHGIEVSRLRLVIDNPEREGVRPHLRTSRLELPVSSVPCETARLPCIGMPDR